MDGLQKQIIDEMGVKPSIDPRTEIRKSIDFIKDYFKKHPFLKTAVLGISGGQDSSLVGKLAQMAMEELRQEQEDDSYQFIAVSLPYGQQNDAQDMEIAMDWIQADRRLDVDIKASVDALVTSLEEAGQSVSDFNKGNIKARIRMVAQFTIAGDEQGVVLGSDQAAESVTGFYTKYGDGAADLMPIYRLNKRQGRTLLQALDLPEVLLNKVPVADLEEDKPMQSDEEALGVTYQAIDDYLEGKAVSKEAQNQIENLYLKSKHKRHLPITVFDNFWK